QAGPADLPARSLQLLEIAVEAVRRCVDGWRGDGLRASQARGRREIVQRLTLRCAGSTRRTARCGRSLGRKDGAGRIGSRLRVGRRHHARISGHAWGSAGEPRLGPAQLLLQRNHLALEAAIGLPQRFGLPQARRQAPRGHAEREGDHQAQNPEAKPHMSSLREGPGDSAERLYARADENSRWRLARRQPRHYAETAMTTVMEPIVLESQTVVLCPLSTDHAGALAEAASESRNQFEYTRVPDGIDDARRYIEAALADQEAGRRMPFVIVWQGRIV